MGKHKFKLSDLIPNSWFYKLKDMSKAPQIHNSFTNKRIHQNPPNFHETSATPKPFPLNSQPYLPNRASFYFSTKERIDKFPVKSNPKAIDIHFPTETSMKTNQNSRKLLVPPPIASLPKSPPYDRDVYTEEDQTKSFDTSAEFDGNTEIKLRPIKTKGLERYAFGDQPSSPTLRSRRLRVHQARNPLMRGFIVVKTSINPWMDFRESVIDMIAENGIREAEDFDELLTCYLVLNSSEYHEMIVHVFKEIWVDLGCD
jgi:uncharacterized protein (TIGR01568 family)